MPHRSRPRHDPRVPEHVTIRVRLRSLRAQFVFPTVRGAIDAANRRGEGHFRILHFSVQSNHLHLVIEADTHRDFVEKLRGFSVSLTRRINRLLFRSGRLVADRWHSHALTSPRAVKRALLYVLANGKKHGERIATVDPLSSAPYFRDFCELAPRAPLDIDAKLVPRRLHAEPLPAPRSWLLRTGWRRHGRISLHDMPRAG